MRKIEQRDGRKQGRVLRNTLAWKLLKQI